MSNRPFWGGKVAIGNRPLVAQTCTSCGLILGRKHYQKKRTSWSSKCNSCFSKDSRTKYGRSINHHSTEYVDQRTTLETATRKGQFWTLKELDEIVEAIEAGFTYAEIAVLLDRSYYSISQTVARFGLKDGWPSRETWVIQLP